MNYDQDSNVNYFQKEKGKKILNGNPAREVEKDFLVLIFIENLFYYRHKKNVSDVSNICNITLIICKTTTLTP